MNTKIHIAFMGGLLLGGCTLSDDQIEIENIDELDELDEPVGPTGDPANEIASESEPTETIAGGIIPAECIGAAVVAILEDPEGSCHLRSLPPNWVWNPMFESGSPEAAAISLPVPEEFQKFCMFEYVGQQKADAEDYLQILQVIDNSPYMSLDSVAADCMGFKEQAPGTLFDPDFAKLLRESFLLNIDAPEGGELYDTIGYQRPVRLEVIDSVSQTAIDNHIAPHNVHGQYMSSLIGGIACPTGDAHCLSSIHHMLAMPRQDYQFPDWTVGEDYASKVDVAVQVYAAVQQWREDKLNHAPHATDRLILNISLGYQRTNQGVDDFSRGPQASLKTALDFASCHGALVFAASGNVRDENCPQNEIGPLAPAEFEQIAAPTEAECHAMGFTPDWEHDFPIFSNEDRPLVYAIGGVDAYDEPLPNSRTDSQPPLVALGAGGVGPDMSIALTGTSVSTAVASATAKLLWSYDARLRPDEVYLAMYKPAWDLNQISDFGFWQGANTRRLSVCAALSYVCSSHDPHECPELKCYPTAPASDGNLGGFFSQVDDVLHDPNTSMKEYDGHTVAPVCSAALPTELVLPQPELPICPFCSADITAGLNNDKLNMSIDPSYQGSITGVTLLLKNNWGQSSAVTIDPSAVNSLNDPTIGVVNVTFNAPLNTKSAAVVFTLSSLSQSNPVALRYLN
jgi:hypothetical protein